MELRWEFTFVRPHFCSWICQSLYKEDSVVKLYSEAEVNGTWQENRTASAETTFVSVPVQGWMLWNCNKMEKRRSSERRSVRLLIYCLGFAARLECDLKPLGLFILIRMRQRWENGRGSCPPLNIIDAWNNIAW